MVQNAKLMNHAKLATTWLAFAFLSTFTTSCNYGYQSFKLHYVLNVCMHALKKAPIKSRKYHEQGV